MRDRVIKKSTAIRTALAGAPAGLVMEDLQPRVENKLKQIFGRQKLYTLLTVMKDNLEIETTGRAKERRYALTAKGRAIHARSC